MKALSYQQYGPPDVLEIQEMAIPKPKEHEVLIKVYATTVSRTDEALLRAKPWIIRLMTGLFKPKKQILGTDFAGVIEKVGSHVEGFLKGDKVFGFNDMGCGSHAQYLTFAVKKGIAKIPDNWSFAEAAASIEGFHYAYNFYNKITISSDSRVLINGVTGAIGLALLQIMKYHGAQVTGVGNSKNINLIKELGADKVIDYEKEDFTMDHKKYDFVLDAVGKSTYGKCKSILKPGGVYISSELGPASQNLFFAISTPMLFKLSSGKTKKVIFPVPFHVDKSLKAVSKMIIENKYRAVIDRKYPFARIIDAYRYVESGHKTGNVIVEYV